MDIKGKTVLILGAGNVGEACAVLLAKYKPRKIILHTLMQEEAERAKSNVEKLCNFNNILLETSFGNVLTTQRLFNENITEIPCEIKNDLLEYLYFPLSDKIIQSSSLYNLLVKFKPDYIIDSINTSTVVGYANDPYHLPLTFLDEKTSSCELVENMLSSSLIPFLVRFIQVLHKYLSENKDTAYVKVSTTGIGGMGMNIKYTHGDLNETGLSTGILGKVAAAGVIHQLLWSLAHTPGINVKIVVPASLIGWEGVGFGKFISNGKFCLKNRTVRKINLNDNKKIINSYAAIASDESSFMEIPYVDSGENDSYSLAEMTAITAQGQMEAITREEVALAVMDCLSCSTRYDLITAMDMASLKSSFAGAIERNNILEKLRTLQTESNTQSIATNNLGPTVTKHLYELYFILESLSFDLKSINSTSINDLQLQIDQMVIERKAIVNQVLSLGLPVLQEGNILTVGDKIICPKNLMETEINDEKIDFWAKVGWVDLREKQIKYWLGMLKLMFEELSNPENMLLNVERNIQTQFENKNLGEILAFLYSLSGGNRRKQ